jgi:hypothetical protein
MMIFLPFLNPKPGLEKHVMIISDFICTVSLLSHVYEVKGTLVDKVNLKMLHLRLQKPMP